MVDEKKPLFEWITNDTKHKISFLNYADEAAYESQSFLANLSSNKNILSGYGIELPDKYIVIFGGSTSTQMLCFGITTTTIPPYSHYKNDMLDGDINATYVSIPNNVVNDNGETKYVVWDVVNSLLETNPDILTIALNGQWASCAGYQSNSANEVFAGIDTATITIQQLRDATQMKPILNSTLGTINISGVMTNIDTVMETDNTTANFGKGSFASLKRIRETDANLTKIGNVIIVPRPLDKNKHIKYDWTDIVKQTNPKVIDVGGGLTNNYFCMTMMPNCDEKQITKNEYEQMWEAIHTKMKSTDENEFMFTGMIRDRVLVAGTPSKLGGKRTRRRRNGKTRRRRRRSRRGRR